MTSKKNIKKIANKIVFDAMKQLEASGGYYDVYLSDEDNEILNGELKKIELSFFKKSQ